MARILVAEDDPGVRSFIVEALEMDGHEVASAVDGLDAMMKLKQGDFDVLFTDLRMPGADGMTVFRSARQQQPNLQVIILTAFGSVENAVEAMKEGAFDYLQKPIGSLAELRTLAKRAATASRAVDPPARAAATSRAADAGGVRLTWGAERMKPVVNSLRKVAATRATVLLLGESGCGKEVAAQALHQWSPRADGPFMAVNCAVLSENLLASELFGHEKGAFTGALQRKQGRIELADGGTFFLDEVGELKLELQSKLLRVLEEKRFERLGSSQLIEVDVRWIAATNRDLKAMVAEGTFREDLYHRLAVFPIQLPRLRDRREDILPLCAVLLHHIGDELGKPGLQLDPEAQRRVRDAPWPGNVRELRNALERAAILADGDTITTDHLAFSLGDPSPSTPLATSGAADGPVQSLAESEREAIRLALESVDGHRRKAAKKLGIGLRTLYDKIKKYDL